MRSPCGTSVFAVTLKILVAVHAVSAFADNHIARNEVRYYPGVAYSGTAEAVRLESGMVQRLLARLGPLDNQVSSIEVGADVLAFAYEQSDFGGSSTTIAGSTPNLGGWNDRIASLILVPRTDQVPRGAEVTAQNGNLQRFFPLGQAGEKVEYSLEGTPLEHRAETVTLKGRDVTVRLYSRVSANQLRHEVYFPPAEIRRPGDSYPLDLYGVLGKIMQVEVEPDADARKNWLKPTETYFCEYPDLQSRCFGTLEKKPHWRHVMFAMKPGADNRVSSILLGTEVAVMVFSGVNFDGRSAVLRNSQNLSSDWNDQISSAIVFPRQQSMPQGITVVTNHSGGAVGPGGADVVFLPMPVIQSLTRSRRSPLSGLLNDRIIQITRSGSDVAFEACQHPDFAGDCVTSPTSAYPNLETFMPGTLWRGASSLAWWEIGPNARSRQVCVDHGDNIVSCTFAQVAGPGYRTGGVSESGLQPLTYAFQEKPVKPAGPPPHRTFNAPAVCGPNQIWYQAERRCRVDPHRLQPLQN